MANNNTFSNEDVTRVLWELYGLGAQEEGMSCKFAEENEDMLLFYWAGLGMDEQLLSETESRTIEEHVSLCEACAREREQMYRINRGEPLIKFSASKRKQEQNQTVAQTLSSARLGKFAERAELRKKYQKLNTFFQDHQPAKAAAPSMFFELGSLRSSDATEFAKTLSENRQQKRKLSVPIPDEALPLFSGLNGRCWLEIAVDGARAQLTVLVPRLKPEQRHGTIIQIRIHRTDGTSRSKPGLVFSGRAGVWWGPREIVRYSPTETWQVQMVTKTESDVSNANNDSA